MASSNARQLVKATLPTAATPSSPWTSDANATLSAISGVLVESDMANAAGSIIEIGGLGTTAGNGIQLGPGDTYLVNVSTAAQIVAVPSANGLLLRGQVL